MNGKRDIKGKQHPPTWRWDPSQWGDRPPGSRSGAARRHRPAFPPWRNRRKPIWVEMYYRGGPEAEVVIVARGWEFIFPGWVSVFDAVSVVNGIVPKLL